MSNTGHIDTNDGFDFFISYYSGTGASFAEHLWEHAKNFGRTAFLDRENIPKNVKEETDDWRSHVDQGIEKSKNFVLIMTLGFNQRPEIRRELKVAFNKGINVFLFKKEDLDSEDLVMQTENGLTDFSKQEYTQFKNECDLLQKVEDRIRGKRKQQEISTFMSESNKLISTEGLEIKQTSASLLEIVIGPSGNGAEWLPINIQLNRDLLSMNPYCYNRCNFNAKRHYFECEPWSREKPIDFFLRVKSNGFFHLVEPLEQGENIWLDTIFSRILEMLFYCIRVMRYKQLNSKQSAHIYLRKVHGLEVKTEGHFQRFHYFFSNNDPEPFLAEFNPMDDWKEIGIVIKKMFEDICREVSFDIDEESVNLRLRDLIKSSGVGNWTYGSIFLPAINADDFGFEVLKKVKVYKIESKKS